MNADILAFGAHPDDVELTVGGTILAMQTKGRSCAIVDMTRGEMGTRGTPRIREQEAKEAASRLGVVERENLGLPDGQVALNHDSRDAVIRVLRKYQPTVVLAPMERDLHPDHAWTGKIITEAAFLSGLNKWETGQAPHRPRTILRYTSHNTETVDLVVDITSHFAQKKHSCLAYKSQFHDPESDEPKTYISGSNFWDWWEGRASFFGNRIGVKYGEGFIHEGPIPVNDLVDQFADFGYYP